MGESLADRKKMGRVIYHESDPDFVEVDPSGRYGRYNEILGKGASKTVYRAFDEFEGMEVAWNQVKLYDCLQSAEELERLYCEIHLLKTLKHQNIMKFCASWVDVANRNINFVTEMFTSGTLRQYRLKHKRVNIRALKHWCRQILKGLLYLHSHDPPVIHRDLKCDNIFVNGNQGEVKIGDLGLAAILRKSHAVHCVGTPEFMAPEVYAEEYNELVDIYSFGMCILEMVTFEYPYSECSHPAQIYKKVISGQKPDALYKVKDPEIREFVEKCLATVLERLSARELLDDPFLYIEGYEPDFGEVDYRKELEILLKKQSIPGFDYPTKSTSNSPYNSHYNGHNFEDLNEWEWYNRNPDHQSGNHDHIHNCGGDEEHDEELDEEHEEELFHHDVSIKGKRREDGSIFLRLRISDDEGRIRNIYFPFDIVFDTALSVATEMVNEIDIIDQDVIMIADMIDGEIGALVPEWKPNQEKEENTKHVTTNPLYCNNCASTHTSTGSFMNLLSGKNNTIGSKNLQILQCLGNGCAATHGRFEEVTYQAVDSPLPKAYKNEECIDLLNEANFWDQPESSTLDSTESHSSSEEHQENNAAGKLVGTRDVEQFSFDVSNDYEHEIHQELKWLNKKHQILTGELEEDQETRTRSSFSFGNPWLACEVKNISLPYGPQTFINKVMLAPFQESPRD